MIVAARTRAGISLCTDQALGSCFLVFSWTNLYRASCMWGGWWKHGKTRFRKRCLMVAQYTQDIDLTFSPPESRLTPIACHIFSEHGGNNSSSQVHIHQRANSGFSERSSARRSFRQSDFGLKRRHLWATLHLQMPEILDVILPCPLALVAVNFQASLHVHICWGVYQNYPAML